jgi:hypothetical protein
MVSQSGLLLALKRSQVQGIGYQEIGGGSAACEDILLIAVWVGFLL